MERYLFDERGERMQSSRSKRSKSKAPYQFTRSSLLASWTSAESHGQRQKMRTMTEKKGEKANFSTKAEKNQEKLSATAIYLV